MKEKPTIPETIRNRVAEIGEPINPQALDSFERLTQISDQSYQLRTIIGAWREQQNSDRKMRGTYATWLLVLVSGQIIFINVVFILLGIGFIKVPEWVASIFIGGVFAEITGLVLIVVKYLFPEGGKPAVDLIKRLFKES